MNHFLRSLAVGSILACLSTAYASDEPTTFLGPTANVSVTNSLNTTTAYSLAGEAGRKNFRVGGTIGVKLVENQLFKFSAEYLWQDIKYNFFTGAESKWMTQGAIGAAYLYEFSGYGFNPQFQLSGYLSHAPNKSLSTISGNLVDASGVLLGTISNNRRIAGSNGGGLAPGLFVAPWTGGRVGLELNYDNVRYDTKYSLYDEDAKGLGGTIIFDQAMANGIDLDVSAAVRQPFNNYTANLNWNNAQFFGAWTVGLFGAYTDGKKSLPNTWNVGLNASYALDQRYSDIPANYKGEVFTRPRPDNLVAWTADPAVYMPQVLAITDENVVSPPSCALVTLVTPIPDQGTFSVDGSFSVAGNFAGRNITYTITTSSATPDANGNNATIDPTTGLVSITAGDVAETFFLNVTATNACGSVSSGFFATIGAGD